MLLQNLRAKVGARLNGDKEAGFTLIELLVVMLILGILAAIALPAFFNQKDKASDSKAKENAHSAQVAIETYATENGGSYMGVDVDKLKAIEPTIVKSTSSGTPAVASEGIQVSGIGPKAYTIESFTSNGQVFKIVNAEGALTYPCEVGGKGGCKDVGAAGGEGTWGT